jgi:hypothetical protein
VRLRANSFSHWFYPLDHQSRLQRALELFLGKGELLEQPEDFEDDHNNDNYSNYVKDVSAHAADSYQIANAMVNISRNLPAITRRLIYSEDSPNESTQLKRPSNAEKFNSRGSKFDPIW